MLGRMLTGEPQQRTGNVIRIGQNAPDIAIRQGDQGAWPKRPVHVGCGQDAAHVAILLSQTIWALKTISLLYSLFPGKEMIGQAIGMGQGVCVPALLVFRSGQSDLKIVVGSHRCPGC